MSDTFGIEWSEEGIGIEDRCDVITKRMIYWIRLDNGQSAKVADVSILINPFPSRGQSYMIESSCTPCRPGLESNRERKLYAEALLMAGAWRGEMEVLLGRVKT